MLKMNFISNKNFKVSNISNILKSPLNNNNISMKNFFSKSPLNNFPKIPNKNYLTSNSNSLNFPNEKNPQKISLTKIQKFNFSNTNKNQNSPYDNFQAGPPGDFNNQNNNNNTTNKNDPNSEELYKKDISKIEDENESDLEDNISFYNQRKRMIYIFSSSILIFAGMYFFLNYIKPEEETNIQKRFGQVTYVGSPKIGGPWRLFNTKGEAVTHNDFSGKYYLIYFGFTQCPDVCPMSLQKISRTLKKLRQSKEYKYFDVECLFVSVDPDRDSNERIQNYCDLFNKDIIGLTSKANDDPELKAMLKEFKIHSSKIYLSKEDEEIDRKNLEKNAPEIVESMDKIKPKSNMKYSLDHTIVTYLMGPNNNFITYLSANLNPEEMYSICLEGIMNDLSQKVRGVPMEKNRR